MEAQFWQRLGLRADDIAKMPWKKVEQYCTIIQLLLRREEMDRRRSGG